MTGARVARAFRSVAASWNRFWFSPVDGLPFSLVRVGVALAGVQLWFATAPLLGHLYSDRGELPIAEARGWSVEWVSRFLMPDFMGAYPAAVAVFVLWGVALAALAVGWRTRAAAWANWLLFVWLFHRNLYLANGGDEVFRLASLYLALGYSAVPAPLRALTLDRRGALARGGERGDPGTAMSAWPLRFIQIQVALVYLVAGFWKVMGSAWWDGRAMHIALANPTFSRFGAPDWPWLHTPYLAVGLAVTWWEFLFPALVAMGRTRRGALAFGVVLHLGILAFMNIGVFPLIMLACYPAFLKGPEARWLLETARRRVRGPGQPSAASSVAAPSRVVG